MEEHTTMQELQADDYMDTVTVYRCKFCSFISTSTDGIKSHVSQVHIKVQVAAPATVPVPDTGNITQLVQTTTPATIPASSIMAVAAMATGAMPLTSSEQVVAPVSKLLESDGTSATDTNSANKAVEVLPVQKHMSLRLPEKQNFVQTLSDSSQVKGENIIEIEGSTILPQENVVNIEVENAPQLSNDSMENKVIDDDENPSETIQVIMNPDSLGLDTETATHVQVIHASGPLVMDNGQQLDDLGSVEYVSHVLNKEEVNDKAINVENNPDVQQPETADSGDQTLAQYDQYTFTTSEVGQTDAGQATSDSAVTTKELFLCGQCSVGFSSIQDCKEHMISEHGQPAADKTSAAGEDGPVSKVDVSTQVDRKKPGRKKKSEMVVEEKPPTSSSDSDEEWTESLCIDLPNGRSRRKRRPPKLLKADYYLGRTKRKARKKTEGYVIRCTVAGCTAKFKEEETLVKHLQCHILDGSPKEPAFQCLDCREKFWFWKQARFHLWKHHKIDMDLLTCPECKVFKTDTMSKLRVHMEIHSSDKPYTCDVCGKGFKQFAQMKNHRAIHSMQGTEESGRWYSSKTCSVCERIFANAKCLKKHIETVHSKLKPFQCTFCDHACSRKAMLDLHLRVHTHEKPFKCDVCQYVTGDHNSLRRHKMRHTGQKPYKCPHCPYACIQAISLKVHIKNKHPGQEGVYNCQLCLFRTISKQQFVNHQLDHKNGMLIELESVETGQKVSLGRSRKVRVKQEVEVSPVETQEMTEVEMQVENAASVDGVITTEDLAKLSNYEGLVPADITAAQLIYSALNAISQNAQTGATQSTGEIVEEGEGKEQVTTHTITFHVPEGASREQLPLQVTQAQPVMLQPVEVVAMESVLEGGATMQVSEGQEKLAPGEEQDTVEYTHIAQEDFQTPETIIIQPHPSE